MQIQTSERPATAARSSTRTALWMLPVFAAWLVGFMFLAPDEYLEDWLPWSAATLLMALPLLVGLGFAIRGLRLGDRLAWVAVAAHGVLLAVFAGLPLLQRLVD